MENNKSKRFYFLKMWFDFFERPEVMMIMSMENGPAIIALFLQMIGQAANRSGYLKFSDSEPYTADIIAVVFRTTKEIATAALVNLQRFHLIDILDDKTIVILNIDDFVGSETVWAAKKRDQRKGQSADKKGQTKDEKGTMSLECPIEIDRDIEIEREIDIEIEQEEEETLNDVNSCCAPAREQVIEFCRENCPHIDGDGFFKYYQKRDWTMNGEFIHDWRALAIIWEENMIRDINAASKMSAAEQTKLFAEYQRKFGSSVPAEYFSKPKFIQLAIATETPLKVGVND
jgi:predicted phage replisome organizer